MMSLDRFWLACLPFCQYDVGWTTFSRNYIWCTFSSGRWKQQSAMHCHKCKLTFREWQNNFKAELPAVKTPLQSLEKDNWGLILFKPSSFSASLSIKITSSWHSSSARYWELALFQRQIESWHSSSARLRVGTLPVPDWHIQATQPTSLVQLNNTWQQPSLSVSQPGSFCHCCTSVFKSAVSHSYY